MAPAAVHSLDLAQVECDVCRACSIEAAGCGEQGPGSDPYDCDPAEVGKMGGGGLESGADMGGGEGGSLGRGCGKMWSMMLEAFPRQRCPGQLARAPCVFLTYWARMIISNLIVKILIRDLYWIRTPFSGSGPRQRQLRKVPRLVAREEDLVLRQRAEGPLGRKMLQVGAGVGRVLRSSRSTRLGCQNPDTPPDCDAGAGMYWKPLGISWRSRSCHPVHICLNILIHVCSGRCSSRTTGRGRRRKGPLRGES